LNFNAKIIKAPNVGSINPEGVKNCFLFGLLPDAAGIDQAVTFV